MTTNSRQERTFRTLIAEVYLRVTASTVEIEETEKIIDRLIKHNDIEGDLYTLIAMKTEMRNYRLKFSKIVDDVIERHFNIVNMAKEKANDNTI